LSFQSIISYPLAFAAEATIFMVAQEIIPESRQANYNDIAILRFIGSFILVMTLDVDLG